MSFDSNLITHWTGRVTSILCRPILIPTSSTGVFGHFGGTGFCSVPTGRE